jgi:hypothetical protein
MLEMSESERELENVVVVHEQAKTLEIFDLALQRRQRKQKVEVQLMTNQRIGAFSSHCVVWMSHCFRNMTSLNQDSK